MEREGGVMIREFACCESSQARVAPAPNTVPLFLAVSIFCGTLDAALHYADLALFVRGILCNRRMIRKSLNVECYCFFIGRGGSRRSEQDNERRRNSMAVNWFYYGNGCFKNTRTDKFGGRFAPS